jgi:hypothetical protein
VYCEVTDWCAVDSLFPFLQGLAPLQHVRLSRRTANYRQSGSISQ